MPVPRKHVSLAVGLGLVASALLVTPASANPAGTGLVITEVYGGGGFAASGTLPASTYANDFIELYNPTDTDVSLDGWAVYYGSASRANGASLTNKTVLSGTVPARHHFLISQAGGANGASLPEADATGAINMSGSSGLVVLSNQADALAPPTSNIAGTAGVVDAVGYGTANTFETAFQGTALSGTTSASRAAGVDTDSNAADFTVGAPAPQNCDCAPVVEPPTDPEAVTIAQIQGTEPTSPLAGDTVTTAGVITANYPTGGYNGFYIQTAGTGDATDETPGASDAVFVFGANVDEALYSIGDHVEVTGVVSEFGTAPNSLTQVVPAAATDVVELSDAAAAPTPLSSTLPSVPDREAHEGELLSPQGPFTVTNSYATNQFGEVGLAAGTTPLIQPTEVADPHDPVAIARITAENAGRAVTLDDGASANFGGSASGTPMSWLTNETPVRVGAPVTFHAPVVLDFRNGLWKFQPTSQITGSGVGTATFENTRPAAPEDVGGDIRLATFNVLNYFPTTGAEFVAMGGGRTCTYYNDRAGNPITNNTCSPSGPRGAANAENLARQQAKTVDAINKLGASIVSLEEIENSVKFGKSRDFAVKTLVQALNAAAGQGTWAHVPSPNPADMPTPAQEDVIRTAFIYRPADVRPVGTSVILKDEVNFDNAREPLAQAFKRRGAAEAFGVIVNHFKSKGSPGTGDNADTGQGGWNGDRIGQANALSSFADTFASARGIEATFLTGDFNSYSMEDPMQVLYDDGYTQVESDTEGEETYSFSGLSGSLDHVLANDAALAMVTGADVWNINSAESVGYEYSRYNYNVTNLYSADPFKSSDHDPEIVGLTAPVGSLEEIQILGTNDFHGRIINAGPGGPEAGAAVLSGAVKELRTENPNTVFAAAGDLIGASTFESFIQDDKPTIDALNEAGLDVSAVGNHEFDQGYDDLVDRVMAPYDAETNPLGGAEWKYIGANVRLKSTGDPAVPASWIKDFGAVEVGFVGAVTEDLPSLVSPDGIADIEVTDIVTATNETADDLEAEGADIIVLLVHEGAPLTSFASATDPTNSFGEIVHGVDSNVDAIVSGHTHLAYNHAVPVPAWQAEGRAVTTRPVVSAGQYGTNLNKLVYTVDPATGEVVAKTQDVLALTTNTSTTSTANWVPNYGADPAVKPIVDAAVAEANVLGAQELGQIGGPFKRARLSAAVGGSDENRGGESTLGNLVAEVQRWATESSEAGSAQIAFMNPGGLRADMVGTAADGYPEMLTYRQAANVQPFANTLINMRLTGAQVKTVLEQQWQRDASGNVPSRPFLRLGVSEGFKYTYDPALPEGSRVTQMWLYGEPIDPEQAYSVTVNSFLASGGDNFHVFKQGTQKRDTGKVDLQAMVDYLAVYASGDDALPVDWTQHAVGVSFPATAPEGYVPGDHVAFDLSSLAFTGVGDTQDAQVAVTLGDQLLGSFPVDNTKSTTPTDEYGKASVDVVLPEGTPVGEALLTVTGTTTGTTTTVPVEVLQAQSTVVATDEVMTYGTDGSVDVTVASSLPATGTVQVLDGEEVLGEGTLVGGATTVAIPGTALAAGQHTLTAVYAGDDQVAGGSDEFVIDVARADATTTATATPATVKVKKGTSQIAIWTAAAGYQPGGSVQVLDGETVLGTAILSSGRAAVTVGPFHTLGIKNLTVRYLGDANTKPSETTTQVKVTRAGR